MLKISMLETDKMLDVMCDLTAPIGNIVKDKKLMTILNNRVVITEENENKMKELAYKKGVENVTKLIPIILKGHREDVYTILSILEEKEIEEIKTQKAITTLKEIKEIITDKDTMDFLLSLM